MNHAVHMDRTIETTKVLLPTDLEQLKAEAKKTRELLLRIAKTGGAGDCDFDDLRSAVRVGLRQKVFDNSREKWKEEQIELINAIVDAINGDRDGVLWIRTLMDSLVGSEVKDVVDRLQLRQLQQSLLPALEAEADHHPTEELMRWYIALLDRNEAFYGKKALNRLAFFYLWYGGYDCDEERARNYFLAMERRGIAPKNPYPGWFGPGGHEELIREILNGDSDQKKLELYCEYAKAIAGHLAKHGLKGAVGDDPTEVENVWFVWIEDPCGRDIRECVGRIYVLLMEEKVKMNTGEVDGLLEDYGRTLKELLALHRKSTNRPEFAGAAKIMLAILLDEDNRLLEIIDREACGGAVFREGDTSDRILGRYYEAMEEWLADIEPLCGERPLIREELLVLNSLYENLIRYYEERGDEEKVEELLKRLVSRGDTLGYEEVLS